MTQSRFNAFLLSLLLRRHRGLATVAVAALVLVASGCGGGSGRLSKSQYEHHIQNDGAAITKAFVPLNQQPSSLKQLADELKAGQDELRHAADDLASVKPPSDVEKDNATLVDGLRTLADELGTLHSAAAKDDPTLVQKALNHLRTSHALLDAVKATTDMKRKGYKLSLPQ
jgi:hypothetical protein